MATEYFAVTAPSGFVGLGGGEGAEFERASRGLTGVSMRCGPRGFPGAGQPHIGEASQAQRRLECAAPSFGAADEMQTWLGQPADCRQPDAVVFLAVDLQTQPVRT